MEWVERHPAPGVEDGGLIVALRSPGLGQLLGDPGEQLPQVFSLEELPLVKGRAVRQAKPGQEVVAVQGRGLGQLPPPVRRQRAGRLSCRLAG